MRFLACIESRHPLSNIYFWKDTCASDGFYLRALVHKCNRPRMNLSIGAKMNAAFLGIFFPRKPLNFKAPENAPKKPRKTRTRMRILPNTASPTGEAMRIGRPPISSRASENKQTKHIWRRTKQRRSLFGPLTQQAGARVCSAHSFIWRAVWRSWGDHHQSVRKKPDFSFLPSIRRRRVCV